MHATPALRVALIDDCDLVAAGLRHMFAGSAGRIELAGSWHGLEIPESVDIALYDPLRRRSDDPDVLGRLVRDRRVRRAVVYSWNLLPALMDRALRDGASGYLSKAMGARELVAALERVRAGQLVTVPERRTASCGGQWPGREDGLSSREAEVLALITQGMSNSEIAEGMYLSPNSVKSYIRSAYRKIGVARRTQAVSWGMRRGLHAGYLAAG